MRIDLPIVKRRESEVYRSNTTMEVVKALVIEREEKSFWFRLFPKKIRTKWALKTAFLNALVTKKTITGDEKEKLRGPEFKSGWVYSFFPISGSLEKLMEDIESQLPERKNIVLIKAQIPKGTEYYVDSNVLRSGYIKTASTTLNLSPEILCANFKDEWLLKLTVEKLKRL